MAYKQVMIEMSILSKYNDSSTIFLKLKSWPPYCIIFVVLLLFTQWHHLPFSWCHS